MEGRESNVVSKKETRTSFQRSEREEVIALPVKDRIWSLHRQLKVNVLHVPHHMEEGAAV